MAYSVAESSDRKKSDLSAIVCEITDVEFISI